MADKNTRQVKSKKQKFKQCAPKLCLIVSKNLYIWVDYLTKYLLFINWFVLRMNLVQEWALHIILLCSY